MNEGMISRLLMFAKLTSAWDKEPISGFREVAPTPPSTRLRGQYQG